MKNKILWGLILFLLVFSLYEMVFRTKAVSYVGEDRDWLIKIDAKLIGLNGSYNIEVHYKGKDIIQGVYYHIHPHYEVGFPSLNEHGYYYSECKSDCGYYDKDSTLLFFITWQDDKLAQEKAKFIELRKTLTDQ
jgi:hypothetical protein